MYRFYPESPILKGFLLSQQALVNLNGDNITTVAGAVTEMNNQGTGGASYDADVIVDTGANLKPSPSGAALLYGASGDYLSSPDSAAASITGDIDIRAKIQPDDWTPASTAVLAAKWGAGGQQSWSFDLNATTGVLNLGHTADGNTDINTASTVATGFVDGTVHWVRVTMDVDNGASGFDTKFYTSDETHNDPDNVTWTQLGSTVTTGTATSIFDSTAAVSMGANAAGSSPVAGKMYRAAVYNGIDGTLAVDMNPVDQTDPDGTTFPTIFGDDLITNGNFASDVTGWSASGGTVTWDSGRMKVETIDANAAYGSQAITTEVGKTYALKYDFTAGTQGNHQVFIGTSQTASDIYAGGAVATADEVTFSATTTTTWIGFTTSPAAAGRNFYIDNVVCGEGQWWTQNGNCFIQNTGHTVVHSIGSVGLETTAGQTISSPGTVFIVGRISDTPSANSFFFDSKSDANARWAVFTDNADSDKFTIFQGTAQDALVEAFDNNPHVFTSQFNGDATTKLTVSGVGSITADLGSDDWDFCTLFANMAGATSMQGYIAQLLVFDYALNETEVQSVQTYLASDNRL